MYFSACSSGWFAEVSPASLFEEQAGSQVCERVVASGVGNLGALLERPACFVAVEGQCERGDRVPIGVGAWDIGKCQFAVGDFLHEY